MSRKYHRMSLHFSISGPITKKELQETANGLMSFLVNRGVVTNDLPEENLLEEFWAEVRIEGEEEQPL